MAMKFTSCTIKRSALFYQYSTNRVDFTLFQSPTLCKCLPSVDDTMPPKRQLQDPTKNWEDMSDTSSSRRVNGAKSKPASKRAASDGASGKDKASRKPARKAASKADANAAKKVKRSTKKEKDAAAAMQTSTNATSKKRRKPKPAAGSARAAFAVKEDDVSSEEEDDGAAREYDSLPSVSIMISNTLVLAAMFATFQCALFDI
jgi:hypothetical protein